PEPLVLVRALEPLRERVREAIPRARLLRRGPELLTHGDALGRELPRLELVPERGLRVVEVIARDLAHAREERDALVDVARRNRREHGLVERRQPAPLLVLLVERDELARRALVRRFRREHALVAAERAVR